MMTANEWDRCVHRFLNVASLRDFTLLGTMLHGGTPMPVPRRGSNPHWWAIGLPGAGKSARLLAPVITQEIAHATDSIVVLDFKPDPALLFNAYLESLRAGIPFRLLDPTPGRWSHIFNPLRQSHLQRQNPAQKAEAILQAMGQDHGPGYGRDHFTGRADEWISDVFAKYPDASIERLAMLMLDRAAFSFIDKDLWKDASGPRMQLAKGATVPWLSVTAETPGITAAQMAMAVDLRQLLHGPPQVLYVALNAAEFRAGSRLIAGLVAYGIFAAAAREDRKCGVRIFLDEGAEFAGPGLSAILDRGRSCGIGVCYVHQHLEQLQRSDQDYSEALESGTGVHVVFSPTSLRVREWLMKSGGTLVQPQVSWQQIISGSESLSDFNIRYAAPGVMGERPRATVAEKEVRRITENDLMAWSSRPEIALVRLVHDEAGLRYRSAWCLL